MNTAQGSKGFGPLGLGPGGLGTYFLGPWGPNEISMMFSNNISVNVITIDY